MQPLTFDIKQAVRLFSEQTQAFLECSQSLSDLELLGPSLCEGWSCLDVVVHVRMGLEEMASSASVQTMSPPDHDAASYWIGLDQSEEDDPVERILWLRRTAASYTRPKNAVEHLSNVINRAAATVGSMQHGVVQIQYQNLSAGDFVATWIVELAVHQLDLNIHSMPPGSEWARMTIESIAGAQLPDQLNDVDSILAAIGRRHWPKNVEKPQGFPIAL